MAGHVPATKNFEIFPKDSAPANCESHSLMDCPEIVIFYTVFPQFYIPLYLKIVKQGIIVRRRVKILFCLTLYSGVTSGSNAPTTQKFLIIPSCVCPNKHTYYLLVSIKHNVITLLPE
jgi:hypothetical protein